MLQTILAFVIVLGLLIFIHEFGHFITAKRSGLKVEEFGFGFPPRIFGIKRGETIYSINWIPFGGFVRILGEDGDEEKDPKSFAAKSVGIRSLVISAGIIMNFILAFVFLVITNTVGSSVALDEEANFSARAVVSSPVITITQTAVNSPAEQADLRPGDQIMSIAGNAVTDESQVVDLIKDHKGEDTKIQLNRGAESLTVTVRPRKEWPAGEGPLGIALLKTAIVKYPWYEAIWQGAKQTVFMTGQIFMIFAGILKNLFTTGKVGADIAGPVGIAVLTGQVLELGIVPLLQFTALLSINLGIINALPFPALDGGRLLFLLIEKIRRKKVSKRVENAVHTIGFGLLLTLVIAITARDFIRFNIIDRIQDLF